MKVVINKRFGGFGLTEAVYKELGIEWDNFGYISNEDLGIESDNYHKYRSSQRLIDAVEKVGLQKSSGSYSELHIVDIPDDIKWYIDDYDGMETLHKEHQRW